MCSYYKYKDVSNIYTETDIINIELNQEYNYNSHIVSNAKIQKYLKDIMLFHIGNNENDSKITYSRLNYEELLDSTINTKADTNSIIANISNHPLTIITVNMDADEYMFKEYTLESKMNIIILEPNSHILFDNLTVYGFINYDFINNEFVDSGTNNSNIYLKIDIPNEYIQLNKTYHDDTPWLEYNEQYSIEQYNKSTDIIENIIYDTSKSNIISIINNNYKHIDALIINLKFSIDNVQSNIENIFKYGEIYNDIINLKNGQSSRFDRNKIALNALPELVCAWMVYESTVIDKWIELKYDNFDRICTIADIPNILHFCLFGIINHVNYFRELYDIPDNLPISVIDMFICKNNNSQSKHRSNTEKTYIILNYKLTTDKGYIKFLGTNGDEVLQNRGDLLVYTSKTEQQKYVTNDESYSLIVLLDITNV
jgi:hypothetical protein